MKLVEQMTKIGTRCSKSSLQSIRITALQNTQTAFQNLMEGIAQQMGGLAETEVKRKESTRPYGAWVGFGGTQSFWTSWLMERMPTIIESIELAIESARKFQQLVSLHGVNLHNHQFDVQ